MISRTKLFVPMEHLAPQQGETDPVLLRPLQNAFQVIREIVLRMNRTPWVNSVLLDAVTFTAGQTRSLDHKLGRTPVRWLAEDVTTGYGSFKRTAWDDKTITIRSENACTVVFRVE